jgi:hypothetical protein
MISPYTEQELDMRISAFLRKMTFLRTSRRRYDWMRPPAHARGHI